MSTISIGSIPDGRTADTVASGVIRNSVAGPLGSPRTWVSSRGRACQFTIAKNSSRPQNLSNGFGKPRLVRNTVEGIRQEHVVCRLAHCLGNVKGISLDKSAVGHSGFVEAHPCRFKELPVNVD